MTLPNVVQRLKRGFDHIANELVGKPASPRPLAVLRIAFSLLLLVQAVALAASLLDTHGASGILQGSITEAVTGPMPSIRWITHPLAALGVSEALAIRLVYASYLAGLMMLLLGWYTRVGAVIAWVMHTLLFPSWHMSSYGVDQFATITLFYMLLMPVGSDWSLDLVASRVDPRPSLAARLSLTVLRVHLCIVYLSSGLDKAVGAQWHNGEAIWRAVMQPQFAQMDLSWLASVPWLPVLAAWGTLVVEIGYAFFVWPRATRRLWVCLTLSLHVGIALFLGIYLFAAAMIILTVVAFGLPEIAEAKLPAQDQPLPTPMAIGGGGVWNT